jgi:hypothetical protein
MAEPTNARATLLERIFFLNNMLLNPQGKKIVKLRSHLFK